MPPLLILAHGAGAGSGHPFMVRIRRELEARGVRVVTFDFPYIRAHRRVPDKAPVLEAAWREQIDAVKRDAALASLPLFIGGKSMGGRMASNVAAQGVPGLSGLVFLGYPLHPPGKPERRRDAHLPSIKEPMLFVQGERDEFGSQAEIRELLPRLGRASLHVVPGGDHSLKVRGAAASQDEVFAGVADTVTSWMKGLTSTR
ncbi:MAG: alpha/beta family hydrolase [Acidobacteriota bacterium]